MFDSMIMSVGVKGKQLRIIVHSHGTKDYWSEPMDEDDMNEQIERIVAIIEHITELTHGYQYFKRVIHTLYTTL